MKVGILIVTYNSGATLVETIKRIPFHEISKSVGQDIYEILVLDDAGEQNDMDLLKQNLNTPPLNSIINFSKTKVTLIRHRKNLGYGGNQKYGFDYARSNEWDLLVLLHGDGQYAPELIPKLINFTIESKSDLLLGSRMLKKLDALKGGMPIYKFVGNIILTFLQNLLVRNVYNRIKLSEWHSGYRVYSKNAIQKVDLFNLSNDFDFDTQIILEIIESRMTINEIEIPTYYGDEISRVNGIKYGIQVLMHTLRFKISTFEFKSADLLSSNYLNKPYISSSHSVISQIINSYKLPIKILDLGCGDGLIANRIKDPKNYIEGVDSSIGSNLEIFDKFYQLDLNTDFESLPKDKYDLIILADVLEHLLHPNKILDYCANALKTELNPRAKILVSLPNFSHFYPRLLTTFGLFKYDKKGILDSTHLRFYTHRSARKMLVDSGFTIKRTIVTRMPISILRSFPPLTHIVASSKYFGLRIFPYQYVFVAELDN